jgi:hypothetical protein
VYLPIFGHAGLFPSQSIYLFDSPQFACQLPRLKVSLSITRAPVAAGLLVFKNTASSFVRVGYNALAIGNDKINMTSFPTACMSPLQRITNIYLPR